MLDGSVAAAPASVNLSSEGSLDWAHWGLENETSFNHKKNVTQQISDFMEIGDKDPAWYVGTGVLYSWTGGTPVSSFTSAYTSICITGKNNGFQITVPADTVEKTLRVYVGAWSAKGKLEAVLTGGNTPKYIEYVDAKSGAVNKVFTLDFKAVSDDEKLVVRYTIDEAYNKTMGNISLQAATLKK